MLRLDGQRAAGRVRSEFHVLRPKAANVKLQLKLLHTVLLNDWILQAKEFGHRRMFKIHADEWTPVTEPYNTKMQN